MDNVGLALEQQGVASFQALFRHALDTLTTKGELTNR